jgi:hypothetical protein
MNTRTHALAWALKWRRVCFWISSVQSDVGLVLDIQCGYTRILFPILRLKMYILTFKMGKYLCKEPLDMNKSCVHTWVRSLHPKYVPFKSVEPYILTTKVASCYIGHYLRYHGDAVDATRHVVRTPEEIYSRRYVLLQCDTCHQTKRMYFLSGGREEDCRRPQEGSTGFSLTSTKLHFYCNVGTGLGQWKI